FYGHVPARASRRHITLGRWLVTRGSLILIALCHRPRCPEQQHSKEEYVSHVILQIWSGLWASSQLIVGAHRLNAFIGELQRKPRYILTSGFISRRLAAHNAESHG